MTGLQPRQHRLCLEALFVPAMNDAQAVLPTPIMCWELISISQFTEHVLQHTKAGDAAGLLPCEPLHQSF